MKQLVLIQDVKINKLKEELDNGTNELNEKKERLKEKNSNISREINHKKDEIIKNYKEAETEKKIKIKKENHYINITLGIHLIKQ